MDLFDEIDEVLLVLDLWVLQQGLIESPHEKQKLAPVDVRWIPDLCETRSSCIVLLLLRDVQFLIVETLHNVGLEQGLEDVAFVQVDGTCCRGCIIDQELQNRGDLLRRDIFLHEFAKDDLHWCIALLLHELRES